MIFFVWYKWKKGEKKELYWLQVEIKRKRSNKK